MNIENIIHTFNVSGAIPEQIFGEIENNEIFKTRLVTYFEQNKNRAFALKLLDQMIEKRRNATDSIFGDDLMLGCYILGKHAQVEDCLKIWETKNIDWDTFGYIDIQLVPFVGLAETIHFLENSPLPEAKNAHQYIIKCMTSGDFDNLEQYYSEPWFVNTMKIKVPCGKCNDYYEYQSDDQNIIGLTGEWSNLPENTEQQTVLISEKPKTGHQYSVQVFGALLIDLEKPVWITYFDPYTTYNGIENDEGIHAMTICKCNILHYTDVNPKKIRLTVEVVETIGLTHTEEPAERINDETLERLEKNYNDPHYFSVDNFEKYSFVSINFQSDFGWNYIVEKAKDDYRIVAENFFDFHRDTWQIRNKKLTDEQADRYGIR